MVEAGDKGRRAAAYYPFCAHSPEYVALQEADALGAKVRFMDLSAADKLIPVNWVESVDWSRRRIYLRITQAKAKMCSRSRKVSEKQAVSLQLKRIPSLFRS